MKTMENEGDDNTKGLVKGVEDSEIRQVEHIH